jgi:methylmalonyl-CoA carboxyltransferase small subunit
LKLQISIDGKTYEAEVEVLEDDAMPRQMNYAPLPTPSAAQPVKKVCRSPVTGIVIKVNIEPGQAVKADDPIMVLEAMKMETNVTAHAAGKVKSVRVAKGDSVKVNQVVVEFE